MADWERTPVAETPPTAAQVYGELGAGWLLAFALAASLGGGSALVSVVTAALFTTTPAVSQPLLTLAGVSVFGIGLAQWSWLAPLALVLWRRRRALALGLLIGGVTIGMLNGTCVAAVASLSFAY
jgi:hypothetical protein